MEHQVFCQYVESATSHIQHCDRSLLKSTSSILTEGEATVGYRRRFRSKHGDVFGVTGLNHGLASDDFHKLVVASNEDGEVTLTLKRCDTSGVTQESVSFDGTLTDEHQVQWRRS